MNDKEIWIRYVSLRRSNTTAIQQTTQQKTLLRWKCFPIRASPCSADIMAENHIDFQYVQDGPMCFDYGFGPLVGFVLQETGRFKNRCYPARKK
jgi:hypothetical protein